MNTAKFHGELIEKINDNAIIVREEEGTMRLLTLEHNEVWKTDMWSGIIKVFNNPTDLETFTTKDGEYVERKMTHKIGNFYAAVEYDNVDFTRFLAKRGVTVEKI